MKQAFGAGIPLLAGRTATGTILACVTSVATRSEAFKICCCSSAQDFQPLGREVKGASSHILSVSAQQSSWAGLALLTGAEAG